MENKTGNKIDDKKEIKISKESDLKKVTANGWIVNSETFAGAQLFVNIAKKFTFNGFENSLEFTSRIGSLAKLLNHHPEIFIAYDSVTITLSTHDAVEQLKSAGQGTGSNADANSDSVSKGSSPSFTPSVSPSFTPSSSDVSYGKSYSLSCSSSTSAQGL